MVSFMRRTPVDTLVQIWDSLRGFVLISPRYIFKAPAKRSQHFNAAYRSIVGRNMVRAFGHPVSTCCDMFDVKYKWVYESATSSYVGCWLELENGQIFHATFVDVTWCCCRRPGSCDIRATLLRPSMRTSSIFNSQHVATGSPNARNMLPPTMLRHVSLKWCDLFWPWLANAGPTMLRYVVLTVCDRFVGA